MGGGEIEKFKYLESIVQKDGSFEEDVKHKITQSKLGGLSPLAFSHH